MVVGIPVGPSQRQIGIEVAPSDGLRGGGAMYCTCSAAAPEPDEIGKSNEAAFEVDTVLHPLRADEFLQPKCFSTPGFEGANPRFDTASKRVCSCDSVGARWPHGWFLDASGRNAEASASIGTADPASGMCNAGAGAHGKCDAVKSQVVRYIVNSSKRPQI